ncbi:MAG: ATPase [Eubacteriales bacterium]
MKVFEFIEELEQEINMSPNAFLSKKKVIEVDIVMEIIQDIKNSLPESIIEADGTLQEKSRILSDAQEEASSIVAGADSKVTELVEEHELTQLAYEKARSILESAKKNAREIRLGANQYAKDVLQDVQNYLNDYLDAVKDDSAQLDVRKTVKKEPEVHLD